MLFGEVTLRSIGGSLEMLAIPALILTLAANRITHEQREEANRSIFFGDPGDVAGFIGARRRSRRWYRLLHLLVAVEIACLAVGILLGNLSEELLAWL